MNKHISFILRWSFCLAFLFFCTPAQALPGGKLPTVGNLPLSGNGYNLKLPSQQMRSLKDLKKQQLQLQVPKAQKKRLVNPYEFGTLTQSQFLPPSHTLEFKLFVAGLVIGLAGIIVSIGTSFASEMDANLTGWKIAALVLDAGSLGIALYMLTAIDMTGLPGLFKAVIWISMAASVLFLIYGIVKLVFYIRRRKRYEERLKKMQPNKQPVSLTPWMKRDEQGTSMGGFAFTGSF